MKRILIVSPSFPAPVSGAEQSDRASGIRQLVRLGYEVRVLAKIPEHADRAAAEAAARDMQVGITLVPYRYSNRALTRGERIRKHLGKLRNPLYLDGAAYEYAEPWIQEALVKELDTFAPDIVWFEYTYLWPLYAAIRRRGIPILTRSVNFEPQHFLEEDGYTFTNYLKFIPKLIGEWLTVRMSDVVFAITPKEEQTYRRMGAQHSRTLPLRGLPRFTQLPRPVIRETTPLHGVFMGSSYRVAHNRAALELILTSIVPEAVRRMPGAFVLHVLGAKVPPELLSLFDGTHVVCEGYVQDLDKFIAGMDFALIPSLMGAGQQQKVFEPIARGIPTITSKRAIASYPLEEGVAYIEAHTADTFVAGMERLRDPALRHRLSEGATRQTRELFSQESLDRTVAEGLAYALSRSRNVGYNKA